MVDDLETLPHATAGAPPMPVDVGEVLDGKYRVLRLVGVGGMACVVAAHHLELDRPVAIKLLGAGEAVRPDAVQRFLAEARAAARLQNPHVVNVLDVGTARTARGQIVPFMVMELLDGADLDAILAQRGRLPLAEAIEYVLQACEAVAEAHALGIVHRDIKPGNLFVTRRRDGTPTVKLLDFGISKATSMPGGPKAHGLTADRELMGSPGYMSPEQVRSAKDVDVRTDVWSLGIVLYELLVGHAPFVADNVADLLVMILHSPTPPLRREVPDVPPEIEEILERCLQKMREHRYGSVDELVAALAPFRSRAPLVVPELPRAPELATTEQGVVSVNTIREAPKHRILLTACLSFAAVGLLLGGIALSRRPLAKAPAATPGAVATEPPPTSSDPSQTPATPATPPEVVSVSPTSPTASATTPTASSTAETSFELVEVSSRGVKKRAPVPKASASGPPKGSAVPTSPPRQRTDW
ncbi:MAG: protein kinase [Deltaproteobacteria bacterium]|nr:protein kinase [Deltaproteobacteria bacterium]